MDTHPEILPGEELDYFMFAARKHARIAIALPKGSAERTIHARTAATVLHNHAMGSQQQSAWIRWAR